ncbi:hypothetical protein QQP08_000104 [Theobroma cacao]|nr:hypothetical protein QQP08_000104 [Theobroma cacao]
MLGHGNVCEPLITISLLSLVKEFQQSDQSLKQKINWNRHNPAKEDSLSMVANQINFVLQQYSDIFDIAERVGEKKQERYKFEAKFMASQPISEVATTER